MAEDFLSELKEKTLSSDKFVEETKKMIDDTFENLITALILNIKENIRKKLSLGEFEIINNKTLICGCLKTTHSNFPKIYVNEFKKIKNANLLSYLNNKFIYSGESHNSLISDSSCHPTQTSLWHKWTSNETNWTGNFRLSEATINVVNTILKKLKKDGIILESINLCLFTPNYDVKISVNDLEKTHFIKFTLDTSTSFDDYAPTQLFAESLTFNYYVIVE